MKEFQEKAVFHVKTHRNLYGKIGIALLCLIILLVLVDGVLMPIWTRHGDDTMVPNIVGLELDEAGDSLERCGLRIEQVGEKYDPNRPAGTVIFQTPDADSKVKKNRFVKVTVSRGGETAIVPDLAGKSLTEAELRLDEWGLRLGDITYDSTGAVGPNCVIATFPQAGSKVPAGMIINLVVNHFQTVDSVIVPELIGKNLAEAKKTIERNGLELDKVLKPS
jgi:beta-lactam-binding protein with PASTA domain